MKFKTGVTRIGSKCLAKAMGYSEIRILSVEPFPWESRPGVFKLPLFGRVLR